MTAANDEDDGGAAAVKDGGGETATAGKGCDKGKELLTITRREVRIYRLIIPYNL